MRNAEKFKERMGIGLRKFFEKYEPSMNKLIDDLDSDGLLVKDFSKETIGRLTNLIKSCNWSLELSADLYRIFDSDSEKRKEKIEYLKKAFEIDKEFKIAEHYFSTMPNSYISLMERLKIYLLVFIKWENLDMNRDKIYRLNTAIDKLLKSYPSNIYLEYFNSDLRNAFAHYTFYFGENSSIFVCKYVHDQNPKKMLLPEFMKEIKNVNVLTEGFFVLLADKFNFTLENL